VQGSGYTVSFYVKPEASMLGASNQAIYFLSTGLYSLSSQLIYVYNIKTRHTLYMLLPSLVYSVIMQV